MPGPAGDIFGAPVPLLDCNGIIDPSTFPVPTADQVYIGDLASDLRKAGEDMAQTGDDVVSTWGGLAGCYTAPESDTLFSALDPVSSDGEEVETGTDRAASALHDFAEELREVKLAWADLTRRAQSFRDSVIDDPEWDKADNFITGRSDNVEENNDIKIAAESIIVRYEKAQRECANAINQGIYGRTRFHSRFDEELGYIGANGFIFDTVNRNTDLPSQWGEGASADKFWYQDAWDAGMDFGLGAIEGVGGMVGAHSAEGWFAQSWGDSLKEYHWDNITAAASLVGAYDAESNSLTRPGSEPAGEAWKELAHSIVPWTEFADRPGYVFATAALNIGGTVVGVALTATGVGSVVGIPLLLWRGASILDGMGTPGRGGLGTDVDLSQLPELPDVNGQNAPVVRLDAEDMEAMGLSPSQIAEIEADLRRVMEEQGVGAGGSGSPQDPRVSDTLAFDDIVNHPDNASFGNQVRGENRQGIDEADQAAKTDPTRTPSSEEGSWTAGEVLDGPEGDGARVPVGAGGRGGDSLSESANPTPPQTRADLSGDGPADLNGGRPGNIPDDGNGNRGPDLADRAPTATNQDGGGSSPRGNGSPDSTQGHGSRPGHHGGNADPSGPGSNGQSSGGTQTNNGGQSGPGGTPPHPQGSLSAEWSKTRVVEERGPAGSGVNQGAKPTRPEHELNPETVRGHNSDLLPNPDERFGDGKDLSSNTSYEVYDSNDKYRGRYVTDENGDIRKIYIDAHYSDKRHPEFMEPRPNAEYHITTKGSIHVYETNSRGRNLSSEGQFTRDSTPRIGKEERAVTDAAKDYYKAYNKILEEDFKNNPGNYPGLNSAPQFEAATWNGGHVVGIGEFGGIPERLNQVAMLDHVNQHAKDDWTLGNSYRNFETSMVDLLDGDFDAISRRSNDPRYQAQVDAWENAYSQGPQPPVIRARVSQVYDPNLPDFEIVGKNGKPVKILEAPPSAIHVEFSINGIVQQNIEIPNLPDLI